MREQKFVSGNLGEGVRTANSLFVKSTAEAEKQATENLEHQKLIQRLITERIGHGEEPAPKSILKFRDGTKEETDWQTAIEERLTNRQSNAAQVAQQREQHE